MQEEVIIVTATKREQALSDIPLAVSAVSGDAMALSGATDIRQLNQLSPSLFVSSSGSEAGGGVARIRGVGTVGDNPGLEGSVALFIDGVYRSRTGVGLSELGPVDQVEVLRGPQGTLFGRNASAGVISIATRAPSSDFEAYGELSTGNLDYRRIAAGVSGPLAAGFSARLDGVWAERDGYLQDTASDRKFNDRNRYLVRGQLAYEPNSDFSLRLVADYAKRDEQCCAAVYTPTQNVSRMPDGSLASSPSTVAALLRGLGATIVDDPKRRMVSVTPGRDFRSDVEDWGISGQVDWNLGFGRLTSITALRDWSVQRGQDADFNNLDLVYYDRWDQQFKTFSQELRLQGRAFNRRLNWLVGGYYAHEELTLANALQYGADYQRFANCLLFASVAPAALSPSSPGCVNPAALPLLPPALRAVPGNPGFGSLAAALGKPGLTLSGQGVVGDLFNQTSRNFAFFTHNVFSITDRLELTLGVRHTSERKNLDATLESNNPFCALVLAGAPTLAALPCVGSVSSTIDGTYKGRRSENQWSGTTALSYRLNARTMAYGSYSRGYKAGGFNVDRAAISVTGASPPVNGVRSAEFLEFEPETVDAWELGLKYNGRKLDLNVAAFNQTFGNFQLNTYTGLGYVVENIQSCSEDLGGADRDLSDTTGSCTSGTRGGLVSKGIEVEANLNASKHLRTSLGLTLADTRYRDDLVVEGRPLPGALFQLPGRRLSNAPLYVVTGSTAYERPIGSTGLTFLLYGDFRYQSEFNTGSDLDDEKTQPGFMLVNARVGLYGADRKWGVELWAQNLFDVFHTQVAFDAPAQGQGTFRAVRNGLISNSTSLFTRFPGEPRTFGATLRFRY